MQFDPAHIHELMIGKLTQNLSEEEELYLDKLIQEEATIRETWNKLQTRFTATDIQEQFNRFDNLDWIPADTITARPVKTFRVFRGMSIAAAILGVSVGLFQLFRIGNKPVNRQLSLATTAQPSAKKAIMLQMANGSTVNLSEQQDSILLGNARLNNTGAALSYSLKGAHSNLNGMNHLTVPIGKTYQLTLSDGSTIWLNADTRMAFPFAFNGNTREIKIEGEAFLQIAKDAKKPFLVHTSQGTVQVLGTSFNINSYDSTILKVALVEGAVSLKTGNKAVIIKPGTQAISEANKAIQLQPFEEDEVLSWREGKYYFTDATLKEISAVMPRWFGIEVVIDNPALTRQRFTGLMDRNKPLTVFLNNLKQTMMIEYSFDKKGTLHLQ